jgi:integrase
MNKRTVALSQEDYRAIITAIQNGFQYEQDGNTKKFRANIKLATILQLEANTGLRIGDILDLTLSKIVKDGNRRRFDVIEQKTKKPRTFTIPESVYSFLTDYAMQNNITKDQPLFVGNNGKKISERAIQKQLAIVCDYLGLDGISTHSFRKTFATTAYTDSNYNIELVRQLLQHSSTSTTQRYIGIGTKQIEEALQGTASKLLIG